MVVALLVVAAPVASSPGVTKRVIRIGVHVPDTGAVPLPTDSSRRAAEIYWEWLQHKGLDINGRRIEVIVRNDNTNPTQAVSVCKQMVREDNVFLLSGLLQSPGNDQVQACARYAAEVGVPYVSLGVMKTGLRKLPNYFAISMTHSKQALLLGDLFVDHLRARRRVNGIVYINSQNYVPAHDAFVARMGARKATVDYDRSVPKNAGSAEAQLVIQEMQLAGVRNAFVHVTPTFFIQLLKYANAQGYRPNWTGIGLTMTLGNHMIVSSCPDGSSIDGARFFSPIPAFNDADRFDPTFKRASDRLYGDGGDPTTWLGWSTSKALRRMIELPGRDLTRKRFISSAERTGPIVTGILPRFDFEAQDHFGGKAIHLLRARCSDRRWHTVRSFVSDF
ncbi:MAG: ABC transporter substrate-binding protein [Gaiellales bacterium]